MLAHAELDRTFARIGQVLHVQWVGRCGAAIPSADGLTAVGAAV
jgi:hypothetical protein